MHFISVSKNGGYYDCEIIANYRWRKRDEKFCEKSGEEVYMVKQQNDIIR